MCVPGCHEVVLARLSRRGFFRAAGAASAAAAAAHVLPTAAMAQAMSFSRVVDLTHTLGEDFPTFFGMPQLEIRPVFNYAEHKFNLNEWVVNEHTGTHMDAPFHFSADGPRRTRWRSPTSSCHSL